MADVAHDMTRMVELQAQLLAIELRETRARWTVTLVLAVTAVAFLSAALPLGLAAAGLAIADAADLSVAAGLGIAAAASALAAGVLSCVAWFKVKSHKNAFELSRRELAQNVEWLKQVFRNQGDPECDDASAL